MIETKSKLKKKQYLLQINPQIHNNNKNSNINIQAINGISDYYSYNDKTLPTTKKRLALSQNMPNISIPKIYYFDNQTKLKKLQNFRKKETELCILNKIKSKSISLNNSNSEWINIKSLMNPFHIENYPSQRVIGFITKMKSQSVLCNMNKTSFKPMSESPRSLNSYYTKKTKLDPQEIIDNERYSKKKVNLEEIMINHQANKTNSIKKTQIKNYQLKQSMLLSGIKLEKAFSWHNTHDKLFLNGFRITPFCE